MASVGVFSILQQEGLPDNVADEIKQLLVLANDYRATRALWSTFDPSTTIHGTLTRLVRSSVLRDHTLRLGCARTLCALIYLLTSLTGLTLGDEVGHCDVEVNHGIQP